MQVVRSPQAEAARRREVVPSRLVVGVRRATALVAVALGLRYLLWRLTTLDGTGAAGWAFLAVEVVSYVGLVSAAVMLAGRWRWQPPGRPGDVGLDVFVTVCGEPIDMVERTVLAALAIEHPHETYVLNDGLVAGRDDFRQVEAMADRLGVVCFTRATGARGKAANLNYAMGRTHGDVVVTVDADHVADPGLGEEILGYFDDPSVGFVCTRQQFGTDSIDVLNNEERLFYDCMQPAKDIDGAAFSCGNGTAYRRTALDSVGGFSEWNFVEDLHTSLELHDAGWTSRYHPFPVTAGTSPRTAAEYLNQRLRWAMDSTRILFLDNPLLRRGMPWRLRLHYLQTTSSYLVAAGQVAFLLAPTLYLLFGVSVVRPGSDGAYLGATVPFLAATLAFLVAHAGWRGAVRTVQSALFAAPVYVLAVVLTLAGRRPDPTPTAKAKERRVSFMLLPQLAALAGSLLGIASVLTGGGNRSTVAVFWATYVSLLVAGPLAAVSEREATARRLRLSLRASVLAVGALGLVAATAGTTGPDEAVVFAAPSPGFVLPPSSGAYLGVAEPGHQGDPAAMRAWAEGIGHRPQLVHWFQQWRSGVTAFRADWLAEAADQGAVPMITWEPWARPGNAYADPEQRSARLSSLVDGEYDDYVREWAEAAAEYRGPMLLRFMHEMNGEWYPWSIGVNGNSAALYVEAWRHVHDIFTDAGATNVSWVWSPMHLLGRDPGVTLAAYPGDDYVDWVGVSAFNWGDDTQPFGWVEVETLLGGTYAALAGLGRPMMVAEISTVVDGGDAAAWVASAMRRIEDDFPLVRAVVWYDARYTDEVDFRLRGASAEGMRAALRASDHWDADLRIVPSRPSNG